MKNTATKIKSKAPSVVKKMAKKPVTIKSKPFGSLEKVYGNELKRAISKADKSGREKDEAEVSRLLNQGLAMNPKGVKYLLGKKVKEEMKMTNYMIKQNRKRN